MLPHNSSQPHFYNPLVLLCVLSALAPGAIASVMMSGAENLFQVLGSEKSGKTTLNVLVSDELITSKGMNTGNIVCELLKVIQGSGGGQPCFATDSGKKNLLASMKR